ncbi:MAG: putative cytokinetic ring protein SteA [Armatimonas sp.]
MARGVVRPILWGRRREGSAPSHPIARLGRRTKVLAPTLLPGDVAVIDHTDLDTVAAQALVAAKPYAVVNNQSFITGRYPNRGPQVLIDAGIPIFETTEGIDLFERVREGETVRFDGPALLCASGSRLPLQELTADELTLRLDAARENLDAELSGFAKNTLRYLNRREERSLLLDPVQAPEIRTMLQGRQVLVVVRGDGYEQDLDRLRSYMRELHPVVLAVDGAADTLLARGIRPDIILGDMDSISDDALKCGAEIIVHAYRNGIAPGRERVDRLGIASHLFPIAGTSEDAAMLLAYEKGADLIVAVGTHTNLEDFLDKGRGGMASTFLVRLKVGSRLVDARGVSKLYGAHPRAGLVYAYFAMAALVPVVVLFASTPFGKVAWRAFLLWFRLR